MLKKVIVSTIFVALIALLVVGAVNRTLARSALTAGNHQESTHTGQVKSGNGASGHTENGQGAAGSAGHGVGEEKGIGSGGGQGLGSQGLGGQGANAQERTLGSQSTISGAAIPWQSMTGKVVDSSLEAVLLVAEDGSEVLVEGQPWRFAQSQGFEAQVGDTVTVMGYAEANEFKAGTLTNLTTEVTVHLRDEFGRPGWGGQGRR